MSWGVVISAAGSVISGVIGANEASKQRRFSKKVLEEGNPFGPYREKYAKLLGELTDDPASFLDNPLYKAAFDSGTQAVMRGFAGEGFLGAGNMATGLQQFGMQSGFDAIQNERRLLASLAGAEIAPGGQGAAVAGVQGAGDVLGGSVSSIFSGLGSFSDIFLGGGGGATIGGGGGGGGGGGSLGRVR